MLNDYELITNISTSNPQQFISNPVNIFLLTKKLTKDFETFNELLMEKWWPNYLEESVNNKIKTSEIIMPSNKDYEGVIKAVHRLQATYLLDTSDIQTGNLSQKYPASRPLSGINFIFSKINFVLKAKAHFGPIRQIVTFIPMIFFKKCLCSNFFITPISDKYRCASF